MWASLRLWLRNILRLVRRHEHDRQLDDEIRFHLAQEMQLRIERGMPEAEARAGVHRVFGSVAHVKEATRAIWFPTPLEQLIQDIHLGCRLLARSTGLSATIVVLLALVIGGNTTLFAIAHGLFTKPAPGIHGQALLRVEFRRDDGPRDPDRCCASFPEYLDIATHARTVQLLADRKQRVTAMFPDGSHALWGALVSDNYFETLGVSLSRGRTFLHDESAQDTSHLNVIVSHRLWQDYAHGAEDVVGQEIILNGHVATIAGVTSPAFQGDAIGESTDVWLPMERDARLNGTEQTLTDRSARTLSLIGRLAPGASLSKAQAEFNVIANQMHAAFPDPKEERHAVLVAYSGLLPGTALTEQGPVFLTILGIITLLTVVLVCANVANLMLSRALTRQRDVAIRKSLGASPFRVIRVLLVEGLLLSLAAGLSACLFAAWISSWLAHAIPPAMNQGNAVTLNLTPDWHVMAYAMLVAILATLAFTLGPTVLVWKQEPLHFLKAGGHGVAESRSTLSSGLVVVQLTLAVLLLTTAGLAYRSMASIRTIDLGFDASHVLLTTVSTAGAASTRGTNILLLDRIREGLSAIPGVRSVSFRTGVRNDTVQGEQASPLLRTSTMPVGPNFLQTLGVTMRAGQEFTDAAHDERDGIIVSSSLAAALWPGQSAIGRHLLTRPAGRGEGRQATAHVIGVTSNGYFAGPQRGAEPHFMFRPLQQDPPAPGDTTFYLRYGESVSATATAIVRALQSIDPRVSVAYTRSMDTDLDSLIWPGRFLTTVLTMFSMASLIVALAGQYAIVAFDVRRRTRDVGIRVVLGASSYRIVWVVMREGLGWAAAGLTAGFLLSMILGRVFQGLLFGVTPTDARTYITVLGVLVPATLLACYLPARHAARIEPLDAIREE
jgi:predicted permease